MPARRSHAASRSSRSGPRQTVRRRRFGPPATALPPARSSATGQGTGPRSWLGRRRLENAGQSFIDDALSPGFPLGDSLELFVRREEAERFVDEVRGDDPELAAKLRIEEQELEAGGLN